MKNKITKKAVSADKKPADAPHLKERKSKDNALLAEPVKAQHPAKLSEKKVVSDIEAVMVLERGQVKPEQLCKALSVSNKEMEKQISLFNKLKLSEESPMRIVEFNGNLELTLAQEYDSQAIDHYRKKKRKLSEQALETVTIVAYKQPVTKAEIDKIRGANSSTAIKMLLTEKLIEMAGNKHAPGKPALFATTRRFLRHFSLKSLDELTPLKEVKNYPFLEEESKPTTKKKPEKKPPESDNSR